jgi:long-chain acyl-CoA synthetase
MGNDLKVIPKYGYYIGPQKKPGETRVLRNALIKEDEDLVKYVDGAGELKSLIDKNAQ